MLLLAVLVGGLATGAGRAQDRKPTAREVSLIRDCAAKNRDNLDEGERQCLFNLVGDPCIKKLGMHATDVASAGCYELENAIWDGLLNDNYKHLMEQLDQDQAAKARAMQKAWVAYRDTTCHFYDDKIQGSMAITMHAACTTRESARRAMLLDFFSRL